MIALPADTDAAAYGPATPGARVEIFWDERNEDGLVYAMHAGTSSIALFDPETMTFTPLARMSAGEKRKSLSNFRGTSPGCPRAPDGVFYHLTVGPPFPDPPKPLLRYNGYLTCYDPKTGVSRNLGPVYFENDRRLLFNSAGTLSHDKQNFVSVGWVEVNDPERIEEVSQLRQESSPPETSKRIYELQLIEVPLPSVIATKPESK
jgi:hypothetical protein